MALVTVEGLRILAYGLVVDRNVMERVRGVTFRVDNAALPFDIFGLHETVRLDIFDDNLALSGLFRLVEKHRTPNHHTFRFVYLQPLTAAHPDARLKSFNETTRPVAAEPAPEEAPKKNKP